MPLSKLSPQWQRLKVVLGFALVVVVLYLAVPRRNRFHYEFQEGKEWTYSTLRAPFDYPLYKPEAEYKRQKEHLEQSVERIFLHDTIVVHTVLPFLLSNVREIALVAPAPARKTVQADSIGRTSPPTRHRKGYRRELSQLLDYVYRVGVLSEADLLALAPKTTFAVLRAQVLYPTETQEVFTPATASAFIRQNLLEHPQTAWISERLPAQDLAKLLRPNLQYDSALNAKVLSDRLRQLSRTDGLVPSGEKIIGNGDVVTRESYLKLVSLRRVMQTRSRRGFWSWVTEAGYFLLLAMAYALYYTYLRIAYPKVFLPEHDRKVLFLMLLSGIMILTGFLVLEFSPMGLYIIPLAIVPLLLRTFYDAQLAFITSFLIISIIGFFAPDSYRYAVVMSFGAATAVLFVKNTYRRGRLLQLVVLILIAYLLSYGTIATLQESSWRSISLATIGFLGLNALLTLATYQLMAPIEKLFGFISNMTLMELCDSNQPLLRMLAEEAPGTFQHSMGVASLAEAATVELGGNSLLARTGALYHDIGKTNHPEYFTENQAHGMSPHDTLGYLESARIIIAHVTEGAEIARKHRLPKQIIDFMLTHHGTSQTKFFYIKYKEEHPNEPDMREAFTYPGPRPFTMEQAVMMMADACEAASRSLKIINPDSLRELIDKIIDGQMEDGQFNDANITFKDITTIKRIFLEKLLNAHHSRIAYPEDPDR
ncbi:MAG: hypothetical protein CSA97_00010 [Bacteroidetes bacterium]|nr:MAG: hypothetical protein CSA97_00010 [Bacteroidota bacterium]